MTVQLITEGKISKTLRYVQLVEGEKTEPALILYRKGHYGRMSMVTLSAAYKYAEPDTAQAKLEILGACANHAVALDMPVSNDVLGRIALTIQNSIPDLLAMKPFVQRETPKVIAEGQLSRAGDANKKSFEINQVASDMSGSIIKGGVG